MTDYNDGKWYGFSGGKMPVHAMSEVECFFSDGVMNSGLAKDYSWQIDPDWIAFRVIKEWVEPKEIYRVYKHPEGIMAVDFECLAHAEYYAKRIASSQNPKPRIDIVVNHEY